MWVGEVVKAEALVERIKINLRHVMTFYYEEVSSVAVWWLWNIPFQVVQIIVSLLLFKYFAEAFGASSPYFSGNFMSFIISGLMVNVYLDSSLTVYYESIAALYLGRVGVGGVHLSRRDYLRLAGVSPLTFLFARVTWRYLTETLIAVAYLVVGVLLFGLKVSLQADPWLLALTILLGIAACSGIGLISASMYWLAGAYRGVEPISWFIRLLVPLIAGVYVPREVLPEWLIALGDLLPQTYVIDAARRILLGGAAIARVTRNLRILAHQAAVLLPLGLALLKYSLNVAARRATIY